MRSGWQLTLIRFLFESDKMDDWDMLALLDVLEWVHMDLLDWPKLAFENEFVLLIFELSDVLGCVRSLSVSGEQLTDMISRGDVADSGQRGLAVLETMTSKILKFPKQKSIYLKSNKPSSSLTCILNPQIS